MARQHRGYGASQRGASQRRSQSSRRGAQQVRSGRRGVRQSAASSLSRTSAPRPSARRSRLAQPRRTGTTSHDSTVSLPLRVAHTLTSAEVRTKRSSSRRQPASGRERRQRYQRVQTIRSSAAKIALALAIVVLVGGCIFFGVRNSPAFAISNVEVEPTDHVTQADIEKLVQVPKGATLLNVDTAVLEQHLKQNPWVAQVGIERQFPSTLKLTITEQKPDLLVVMNSGSLAWYLGDSGSWVEPVKISTQDDQSVDDAALQKAQDEGCLLITDVPATVDPQAAATATDDVFKAIQSYRKGFSSDFSKRVVSYAAPSVDSIACTLSNGVEVLLGSPKDIATKEQIVTRYLEKYSDNLLYLNVRVVSSPAVRVVDSQNVQSGSSEKASSDNKG